MNEQKNLNNMEQIGEINFSYNWNNKLECNCFTTLRLTNQNKYQTGKIYQIKLKNVEKKLARIIEIKVFELSKINEFISRLDTGYSKEETIKIINKMYKLTSYQQETSFMLILLETVKEPTT